VVKDLLDKLLSYWAIGLLPNSMYPSLLLYISYLLKWRLIKGLWLLTRHQSKS